MLVSVSQPEPSHRSLRYYLSITLRGLAMGSADVVPGVSGGTMAFILGIYEQLLDAISAINLTFIQRLLGLRFREAFAHFPWQFLLALGLGIFLAIATMAQLLSWALDHYPTYIWGFFFGLVLASVFVVRRRVSRWTAATLGILVVSALVMYWLVGLLPSQTPEAPWFLFLSGILGSCGMILPGISGAFILVLLGKYEYVLDAVVNRDFLTLAIVAAGAAFGLVSVARLLRWLFRHYHDLTVAALMGLMLGSLRKIWPWKETLTTTVDRHGEVVPLVQVNVLPDGFTSEVGITLALAILGFLLVVVMDRLASRESGQQQAAAEGSLLV